MANKRLYYAIKQLGLRPDGDSGDFDVVYGAQSADVSTNFNLTQIFELGQLAIYQNVEDLPDVEVSVNKIFDGKPLIWHLATQGSTTTSPTLAGRSNTRCSLGLALFPDTNDSATGTPNSIMECSGLYPRTLTYTFTADGSPFTESITFVGNDKIYNTDSRIVNTDVLSRAAALSFNGVFAGNNDTPTGIVKSEGIIFSTSESNTDANSMIADSDCTILPPDVDGISADGVNDVNAEGQYNCHVQSITISTDLGREALNELGRRGPYHRYATFPTEVTCAIEALSLSGDQGSAVEAGIYSTGEGCGANNTNLVDRTIRIATCEGYRFYLGIKNRLSSIEFGGGTTDGGNDTNTYNFSNFNDLTIMHQNDPHASGSAWWTARDSYLINS